jgi:hypothetical protein
MYKSNTLFDISKLVLRPLPIQREYELDYYDFLSGLPPKMDLAFKMTRDELKLKPPLSVNKNWFANTMNGNLIYLIGTAHPEFLKYTGRGSYCLFFNFKYEGYVKKLTGKKLFPSYNHTDTSLAITNQRAFPKQEPLPVIYIGYTSNRTHEMITGYYAVCIKGKERLWKTDLTAIEKPVIIGVDQSADKETVQLVTVKEKAKRNAQ